MKQLNEKRKLRLSLLNAIPGSDAYNTTQNLGM
jgi:hypothetical protein